MRLVARIIFTFVVALGISSCAAPPSAPLPTPSGRPEVTISGVTKKQVTDAIVAGALSKGTTVKSVSEYAVVLTRPGDTSNLYIALQGSRYDGTPEIRLHLNLVEVGAAVKVFARGEIVTNPGSAFERVRDITEPVKGELYKNLTDLQQRLAVR